MRISDWSSDVCSSDLFTRRGRSNDFRELDAKLFVVAVELDSGEPVLLGGEGWDDVPISRAVQASAALPGLYPPVEVRGRNLVDGALRRPMNDSVDRKRVGWGKRGVVSGNHGG